MWQKLEEENADFFRAYYIRLKLKKQIILFNHLLEHQYHLMKYPVPPKVPLAPMQNGIHPMPGNLIFLFQVDNYSSSYKFLIFKGLVRNVAMIYSCICIFYYYTVIIIQCCFFAVQSTTYLWGIQLYNILRFQLLDNLIWTLWAIPRLAVTLSTEFLHPEIFILCE